MPKSNNRTKLSKLNALSQSMGFPTHSGKQFREYVRRLVRGNSYGVLGETILQNMWNASEGAVLSELINTLYDGDINHPAARHLKGKLHNLALDVTYEGLLKIKAAREKDRLEAIAREFRIANHDLSPYSVSRQHHKSKLKR